MTLYILDLRSEKNQTSTLNFFHQLKNSHVSKDHNKLSKKENKDDFNYSTMRKKKNITTK